METHLTDSQRAMYCSPRHQTLVARYARGREGVVMGGMQQLLRREAALRRASWRLIAPCPASYCRFLFAKEGAPCHVNRYPSLEHKVQSVDA
jgi:hypothetical protein